jgi:hypothetical protein
MNPTHVNHNAIRDALFPAVDGAPEASKVLVVDSSVNVTGLTLTSPTITGGSFSGSAASLVSPTLSGTVTMADSANVAFNVTTGSKLGTAATQKIGFWNAVPVVQPSVLAAITVTQPTATVFGFTTTAQFNNLIAAVNQLIANDKTIGLMATA